MEHTGNTTSPEPGIDRSTEHVDLFERTYGNTFDRSMGEIDVTDDDPFGISEVAHRTLGLFNDDDVAPEMGDVPRASRSLFDLPEVDSGQDTGTFDLGDPLAFSNDGSAPDIADTDDLDEEDDFFAPRGPQGGAVALPRTTSSQLLDTDFKRKLAVGVASIAACIVLAGTAFAAARSNDADLPNRTVFGGTTAAPAVERDVRPVTITYVAPGYSDGATPLMYHVFGQSDDDAYVNVYGMAVPGSQVSLDLPMGTYEIEWSTAFLPDGSFYRIPDRTSFAVDENGGSSTTVFELVDPGFATVEQAKEAFDNMRDFMAKSTDEYTRNERGDIEQLAILNASNIPAVAAAGGLDMVGVEQPAEPAPATEGTPRTEDATAETTTGAQGQDQDAVEEIIITYVDNGNNDTNNNNAAGTETPMVNPVVVEPVTPIDTGNTGVDAGNGGAGDAGGDVGTGDTPVDTGNTGGDTPVVDTGGDTGSTTVEPSTPAERVWVPVYGQDENGNPVVTGGYWE